MSKIFDQPKPRFPLKSYLIILSVVILVAGAGCFLISEILHRRELRAEHDKLHELEKHELGPDNPPGPNSFFPRDAVPRPPIVKGFQIVSAKDAAGKIEENELVLAVEINGQSRAYPINMMQGPSREVFNDSLGGRDIAATW